MKKKRYLNVMTAVKLSLLLLIVGCQEQTVVSNEHLVPAAAVDTDTAAMRSVQSGQPMDARVYCNRGFAYVDSGRFQEAIGPLQKGIALQPDLAEAHCSLGIAYIGLDRLEEATESLEQAIALKPDYTEAQAKLGMVWLLRRQPHKAVALLEKAVGLNPDNADNHFALGAAYAKLGSREAALAQYEIIKNLDPGMAVRFLQEFKKQEQLMANKIL